MSWSINIGNIAGTAVRIHVTFLLFLVWIFLASWYSGGPQAAWSGLAFMILLFACVLAHEFGHIFTARAFGVPTPDVTLLPIGGVARLERIPEKPSEELLVALANQANGLARHDGERDSVDGMDDAIPGRELRSEVSHF